LGFFWTSCGTTSFSNRIPLHGAAYLLIQQV